jgi:phage gp36-like protein
VAITNGYCTLAELKASLNITDAVDDTALEAAITSASRMIDDYTERFFYVNGTTGFSQ